MTSAAPAAVTVFFNMMTSAFASDTTMQVYFGAELSPFVAPKILQILGVNHGDQQPAEMGPSYRREEQFHINCKLTSYAGDQGNAAFLTRMNECYAAFAIIEKAIGNNPWLSVSGNNDSTNTVRYAEIATYDFMPEITDKAGSVGEIDFSIFCSQRITSLT